MRISSVWIDSHGRVYRDPKNTTGLQQLVPLSSGSRDVERYRAFRADILRKGQPMMTEVASILCKPAHLTTTDMVDQAFDSAMKRFA